ncbi:apolipoprotein N-acyltransferase [Entomomonas asaccharolytica]|uniref:Apolipoprotein N-acyltransferase n=1 Tax=Entomomonas asaccharolytica TaxID=2785331 RepID=A0A974RX25_9GAMM|nr:apolipoprotein N-acyltransferase [Entomomonas asaccharolytica]QQP85806.1 apolipoprotein N-acyltransferase [Entomomonas asaccharolytica]
MLSIIIKKGWLGHLIAFLAGVLTPLFLAPFNIWPIAFISVGCFYLGLKELTVKQAIIRSWCYGFGAYIAGVSWIYVSINTFGNAPVWLAATLTIAFCMSVAFFFVIPAIIWVKWFRADHTYFIDAFAFAGLWAIQEWFRGWFLTGFPWLYTGYSQLDAPLAGFAPIGGVWLISFLIALITVLLIKAYYFRQQKIKVIITFVMVIALPIVGMLLNKIHWTTPVNDKLPVTLVQGNIAQGQKWEPSFYRDQLNLYWALTQKNQKVDSLVIWPENAIPYLKESVQDLLDNTIGVYEKNNQATLITGLPIRQQDSQGDRYYNGITVAGEGEGTYLKQKLVPFGEYVPLQDMLRGMIEFFDLPMSDFRRGNSDQPLLKVKSYQVAPFICYEVVYPDFVASLGAESNLLITISNDTWFGHSIGPKQHIQMAQMRALEADRWMARATNNGITAIIDNKGQIVKEIPSFEVGVLQGEVTLVSGKTPYQIWYSYFILSISFLGLLVALFVNNYKK